MVTLDMNAMADTIATTLKLLPKGQFEATWDNI